MNNLKEMNELYEVLNSFIYTSPFTMLLISLLMITSGLSMVLFKGEKGYFDKKSIVCFLASILIVSLIVYNNNKEADIENELEALVAEHFKEMEMETATVKTNDIIKNEVVYSDYCLHISLSKEESCRYVEFVSDGDITSVFIPLKEDAFANKEDSLTITYQVITEEERAFLNKYLNVSSILLGFSERVYINKDRWALGLTIEK